MRNAGARRLAVLVFVGGLCGCTRDRPPKAKDPFVERIDRALHAGAAFLWAQQRKDGSFGSSTYGAFQDGRALTPLALSALLFSAAPAPKTTQAYARGVDFVASLVDEKGDVARTPHGLDYPVYSAALALLVLSIPANARHERKIPPLVQYIKNRQLAEHNGWSQSDPPYGGFGYWHHVPKKPASPETAHELLSSNLSATLFAVGALRLARVPPSDPVFEKARVFVERCQNFPLSGAAEPRFDDGGFFFTPTNDVQNKAGIAGKDARGRVRYRSYSSMTADGVRALLSLGRAHTHPRVQAAARWLASHFNGAHQSGHFPPERAFSRDGSLYYNAWTVAHALWELGMPELEPTQAKAKVRWARRMATDLLALQRRDGSWKNPATDLREDDPVLATSFALAALGLSRLSLTGEWRLSIPMRR